MDKRVSGSNVITMRNRGTRHVLHISYDYPYSPIYEELLSHLSTDRRVEHTMYVPLSMRAKYMPRCNNYTGNVHLHYSRDYHWIDRVFYHRKVKKVADAIGRQVAVRSVDLLHAHSLFSLGGVAYTLKREANLDYIVAVRNTDLNLFFPIAVHLRHFGVEILKAATKVVFVSPNYKDTVIRKYVPAPLQADISRKSVIIPNGISDFWIDHRFRRTPRSFDGTLRLLFVGSFTKNKNIPTCIEVARLLRRRLRECQLAVVGGGPEIGRIKRIAAKHGELVSIHEWADRQQLLKRYREADIFIMPSFHETFGLVYAEAMSQGCPIIYTMGEGIDGYFPDGTVGYACNPLDAVGIVDRIMEIVGSYDRMSTAATESCEQFNWRAISDRYLGIYTSVVSVRRDPPGRARPRGPCG